MIWSKERWQIEFPRLRTALSNHWLEIFGLTVAISAFYCGGRLFELFGFMSQSFAENISSEIFGIGLTISILKIFADRYEAKRWKHIQKVTFGTFILCIDDMISQILGAERNFLQDLGMESPKLGTDVLEKFIKIIETTDPEYGDGISPDDPKIRTTLMGLDSITNDMIENIYENVKWDLYEIQNVLIPRILHTPVDQNIKDRLTSFDAVIREFGEINAPKKKGVMPFSQVYTPGKVRIVARIYKLARDIRDDMSRSFCEKAVVKPLSKLRVRHLSLAAKTCSCSFAHSVESIF